MEHGDIEEVVSIEKLYFNKSWSKKTFQKLLDHQDVEVWVALQGGDLLGYVVLQCSGDEAELINIAVRKGKRKLGIGSALLSKTVDVAVGLDVKKLFLEVVQFLCEAGVDKDNFSNLWLLVSLPVALALLL